MKHAQSSFKPRVGVGIIVIKEGKVLLGKRIGAHESGCFSSPGGHLEFKETIEGCARRELAEEVGLKALSLKLGPWTEDVINDEKHYISLFVFVTEFEGEPQLLEPHKCQGWDWYAWDELPSPLAKPLISFIKHIGSDKLKAISASPLLGHTD